MPIASALAAERSIILSRAKGPRSLTFTVTDMSFSRFVTRTSEGIGSVLCAAVNLFLSNVSPLLVGLP